MVKQVARKSEAAAAGMKAFDVILKVGADSIATVSDWERSMRTNQGKSVQVTVLRDKKPTTLTLQVDSKKKSELEFHELLPDGPCPLMAVTDPDVALELQRQLDLDGSALQSMRDQGETLKDQFKAWQDEADGKHFEITPQQADEFRKQAEEFGDAFKGGNFGIDPKQMDELHRQMEQFNNQFFGADSFKFDPKHMEEFRQNFNLQDFKLDLNALPFMLRAPESRSRSFEEMMRDQQKQEMDQLKRQHEEVQALWFDHFA
jgi:hypothetical protein